MLTCYRLGKDHPLYEGPHTYHNWESEYQQQSLVEACEKSDFIIAHNAKFELGWLRRCGLDISKILSYCTQIAEYCVAGNRKLKLTLDACLARYGLGSKESLVSLMIKEGICPSEIPASWLLEYGSTDVEKGEEFFLAQRDIIFKNNLHNVTFTRNIVTAALESIERVGMHIDAERVIKVYQSFTKKLVKLETRMDAITGGINTRSPDQRADFLYKEMGFEIPRNHKGEKILGKRKNDNWPDGIPTTNSDYVNQFKPRNRKQKEFLDLLSAINKIQSAKSKILDKFFQCVTETEDHIVHFNLNQTITGTHRLSSTGRDFSVQGQNFPKEFKPLFNPRFEGWEFGEGDEAQLEYRTAVSLAKDEAGMSDILNGVDSHGFTASIIFKEEWDSCGGDRHSVTGSKVRNASKEHTFKPLYGGKSGTLREQEYYKAFQDKHVQITEMQGEWIKQVYRHRKLTLPTGLIIYFEDAKMNRRGTLIRPDGRPVDQAVCNYPVQNLATAEIVLIAIAILWRLMVVAEMKSFLVNTVHDSALAEIFPPERELFNKFVVYSMIDYALFYLDKIYNIQFCVPLDVETSYGTHWATTKHWEREYLE